MSLQTKQRIIGVIVLVFLGLIILPWLFGHSHPEVLSNHAQKDKLAQAPEVISEPVHATPPVPDQIEQSTIAEPTPVSGVYARDQENGVASLEGRRDKSLPSDASLVTERPVADDLNASKISRIENEIIKTKSVASNSPHPSLRDTFSPGGRRDGSAAKAVVPTRDKNQSKAELKKPNITKIKVAAIKMEPPKFSKKKLEKAWVIQLGSFSTKSNADKLVQQLKSKGYPVYSVNTKNAAGESVTKVLVGPESERHTAENVVTKIDKLFHVHGVIIKG